MLWNLRREESQQGKLKKESNNTLYDITSVLFYSVFPCVVIRCETPGRIIVLTSNHYDKLDKALTRPGRIDCTIHMQNISHSNLQKMCEIYFGKKMMKRDLEKIKERSHSPAEIINLYTIHKNDMKGFIQSLQIKGDL